MVVLALFKTIKYLCKVRFLLRGIQKCFVLLLIMSVFMHSWVQLNAIGHSNSINK